MSNLIGAARDFVKAVRADGSDDQMLDEFGDLADEVDELATVDATIGADGVHCPRCRQIEPMPMPMPVSGMMYWVQYHAEKHRHCKAERSGENASSKK